MTRFPILTAMTFLPLVSAAIVLLLGRGGRAKWIALVTTVATLGLSAALCRGFDRSSSSTLQFVESVDWIPEWSITYGLGVDGISLPFVLLTALLSVLCIGASWTAIRERTQEFYASLLVAETAMLGVFAASNLFVFFVSWELTVVPLFLLIGVWGGSGRVYAAVKFLLFTLSGSVLMLVGMIALHHACGTLDFRDLAHHAAGKLAPGTQAWLFAAFLAAFAVKVPMFPVHTWLPNAHTEAPTAGSVILAGILLKLGAYGFLRLSLPVLPDGVRVFLEPMRVVSVVAIVYGAYVTLVQTDFKRLIAYSSISHMGFVTLGIFTLDRSGVEGAILQMINHGIVSAALFLCVGMVYERTHTREIKDYGGLVRPAPAFCSLLALFGLAASGFPGLNSFVGEFLVVGGAFRTRFWLGAAAIWGVALGTTYVVWLYYRVAMGKTHPRLEGLKLELDARELVILTPLALLTVGLGLHPDGVLDCLRDPVARLLSHGLVP